MLHWGALPFLAGLGALSVPIIIHMMQSPRARQVDFPTIRFLRACQKHATRRTRIKNLLLLLLRMAIIALIVFGMAQPSCIKEESEFLPDAPVSMVIVVDNSYSMGYEDRGKSRFKQAKDAAVALVDTLKPGDEVAVLLMNETSEPCVRQLTTDFDRVKEAIAKAQLSLLGTDVEPAMKEALLIVGQAGSVADASKDGARGGGDDEDKPRRRKEIHLLTDLQAHSWDTLRRSGHLKGVDTEATIKVARFAEDDSPNYYISKAELEPVGPGKAIVVATVNAAGAVPPGCSVTLVVDGEPTQTAEVSAAASEKVQLAADFPESRTYQCELRLKKDDLAIDDSYYFTVTVAERSKVVVVDGDPSAVGSLAETYYLARALNPGLHTGRKLDLAIEAEVVPASGLGNRTLRGLRCVFLCNVGRLDGRDQLQLERLLREGGSVAIFCGSKTTPEEYNRWKFMPIALLPERLGDPTRKAAFTLRQWGGEEELFDKELNLLGARFFMCQNSDRETLKKGGKILASFSNDAPALIEGRFEDRGKVLLFTSTCDLEWNNLALRPEYPPLLHEMIRYLSSRDATLAAFRHKEKVTFDGDESQSGQPIVVKPPPPNENKESILHATRIQPGLIQAAYEQTDCPGLYKVETRGEFTNKEGFGVNLDVAKESNTLAASPAAVKGLARQDLIEVVSRPARSVVEEVRDTEEVTDYWLLLFKLAVLVFVIESLFGNLVSRVRKAGGIKMPLFEVLRQRNPGIQQ